ncbi:MAG TPA: TolC family protein [Solirubrobacteraceae bacterium]
MRIAALGILILYVGAAATAQQAEPPVPAPPPPAPRATPAPPPSPLSVTPAAPVAPSTSDAPSAAAPPLLVDEAVRLALLQASTYQQATLNERIAAEDVRQARAAFLPRLAANFSLIHTSPASGVSPRVASYIAANAVDEYLGLVGVTGDLDLSGRLRATLERNVALLESARFGTEVARRALIQATSDAYYAMALATARRRAAEQNVASAEEFERVTALSANAGEVAAVDLARAQLQTITRRDELEQARAAETAAASALRILVGYDFRQPIVTADLVVSVPQPGEIDRLTADMVSRRPEFAQLQAERRAAELGVKVARAERRPGVTYALDGGVDTDSLRQTPLREHRGFSATLGVTVPIWDWGARRSRELQARDRAAVAESARIAALRAFEQQFYDARAQALAATTRIRLARDGLATAERNLDVSISRYRAGEAPILEVTDAQTTLIAQRAAYYQALFDYQSARARLSQATGQ